MEPRQDAPPEARTDDEGGSPDEPQNWSDERRRAYRRVVAERRERQARAGRWFALAVIALVAAGVALRAPESWWVPGVGATALLGLVFRLANWKCPNCGERLPTRGTLAHCHGCGAPLD
jgi:hypothetical protein